MTGLLLGVGLSYAFLYAYVGLRIPCLFHILTTLECPSCGISRMLMAILRLDFAGAVRYNPAIFLALPVLGALLCSFLYRYVRYGMFTPNRWQTVTVWVLAGYLVLFGILRNLPILLGT